MQLTTIVFPIILAFITTVVYTPISLIFIRKWGLIDDPKTHKHPALLHTKPIPRGGGIPLFLGIITTSFFFLPVNRITVSLFVAAFIALITGILDDKHDISRYFRFAVNIFCALIVVGNGITIPFITNPLGGILRLSTIGFSIHFFAWQIGIYLSNILALVWIVWVMNMLNWSKGVDGQMPGVVAISSFVIGLLSLRFSITDLSTLLSVQLSFIISGAALGFLIFNYFPAKIFPGYGATSVYLLLSAVSILSGAKLATAILVMGVPMVDGAFTILRRLLSGKSPFWGDNRHLHHLLLKTGLGQRGVALFYWIISAILGAVSLTLSSKGKLFAIVMLGVVLGGGLLFLHITLKADHEKENH